MRAAEFILENKHVDEGWREVVAAAIPIAGLGFHGANLYKGDKVPAASSIFL